MFKKVLSVTIAVVSLVSYSLGASAQDYKSGKDYQVLTAPVLNQK